MLALLPAGLWAAEGDLLVAISTSGESANVLRAVAAAKEHGWERVQVAVPERPGINGGLQQRWWGVAGQFHRRCDTCVDLPGFGLGGFLGLYWTTASGIERFNQELFKNQAHTMTELTGLLMTADLDEIRPE